MTVIFAKWILLRGQWYFGKVHPWHITVDTWGTYVGTEEEQWAYLSSGTTLFLKVLIAIGPTWAVQRYWSRRRLRSEKKQ
jgi:hypothetical protein